MAKSFIKGDNELQLPWMRKIRNRLEDKFFEDGSEIFRFREVERIIEFIKPILEYGEAEEKRIKEMFDCIDVRIHGSDIYFKDRKE